eukprot:2685212-Alexandrium_andersonii.AAC.1
MCAPHSQCPLAIKSSSPSTVMENAVSSATVPATSGGSWTTTLASPASIAHWATPMRETSPSCTGNFAGCWSLAGGVGP